MGVILLSFRQTIRRVVFWARLTIWRFFFSLPLITWPAATAAFYQGVADGLRDPFDQQVNLRESFVRGFFDHFARSTGLFLVNAFALAVIVLGILFWSVQEQFAFNLLAGVALPFLIYWWMCQPFLVPILIEYPELSILDTARAVIRLVAKQPLYCFVTAFVLTWLFVLSLPLVGPLSLMTIPFLALTATQSYWAVAGKTIPDLIDPVKYAEHLDEQKKKANQ